MKLYYMQLSFALEPLSGSCAHIMNVVSIHTYCTQYRTGCCTCHAINFARDMLVRTSAGSSAIMTELFVIFLSSSRPVSGQEVN